MTVLNSAGMGAYTPFHWLIVAALLAYLWLLVKVAKPGPITKQIKDSKPWLTTQTVVSWLCSFLFGLLTLAMLGANANRQRPQNTNPGDLATGVGYLVGLLIADLGVPLLFALSVRWTRIVMSKWKTLKVQRVAESATIGPTQNS
jgi:hypothetical protein